MKAQRDTNGELVLNTALPVNIISEDIGDSDCRKLAFDVWQAGVSIHSEPTMPLALQWCKDHGLKLHSNP